ncbi:MAG TPA: PKD domain-containing protein, partial [Flavisolibacter sp.]|nr:PKD domain-containing protein [Flavisolibacter sp.]
EKQVDLVTTIFSNDPNVYWGFTGATGGQVNLQQFCTALDPLFTTGSSNNVSCAGSPVVFANASESFAPITNYNWSFGDGTSSTAANPPPHVFPAPGPYKVTLKITGQDGCERDSSQLITIASDPSAALQVFDTCFNQLPRVALASSNVGVSYRWTINGTALPGNQQPALPALAAGNHRLQVIVSSDHGCGPPDTADANFLVKPLPEVDAIVSDGCAGEEILFQGLQKDVQTSIIKWAWTIDDKIYLRQNVERLFNEENDYRIRLWAMATNGCASDTIEKKISIARAFISARDTSIIRNMPAQLMVSGNGDLQWSPLTGLSDPTVANPNVLLDKDQKYTISVTTPEGCTASDTMLVKVFTGPAIYVPTAFTPNGDSKNESLLPVYVGIKEVKQFAVFNRWGQMLFRTNSMVKGWNGKSPVGTYVWVIQAVDYLGQPLVLKGTVTIIR